MDTPRAQIIYLSHGGGPLPLLGDPGHARMVAFMQALPARLRRPARILVISAHWEEFQPALTSAPSPSLFFDYYGFPPQTYQYRYPAPGDPAFAQRCAAALQQAGLSPRLDDQRGLDHGVFIPLMLLYPEAIIPVVQLSILASLSPADHLALGRALQPLLTEDVLVIGSGFSYHNLRAFSWGGAPQADPLNDAFQDWLIATVSTEPNQERRESALLDWAVVLGARHAHPREDHLLPLHVCAALAGRSGEVVFDDQILGKRSLAFAWL